ncbi:hypothetical protein [Pseudomonas sp. UBA2684]|uniref:hypothetical protein n=1 Tax=Pseudomonas sp. UBA2684 TaxID=1947311 RepID=UPI000E957F97|nr:hypothetical protein [Pseudomonas sp. UBA2684]HBX55949.1 hypothetical protein [Pseudomonas sp.]|tara:strand:+ start:4094 stop:4411 length:318 start_codon:yes stop_codon:yes gene_type:complete
MELNREVLDCMKSLRRRLRDELAVDIRMSQPNAINTMLSACLSSTSEETRQLGQLLAQYSDQPFNPAPDRPAPRLQAGHPLLVEDAQARPASGSVRMYRGQRVYA